MSPIELRFLAMASVRPRPVRPCAAPRWRSMQCCLLAPRTFQNHTVKPGVAGFEWLHGGVRTTRSCRSQRKGPAAVNLWQSLVCRVVPGGRAHPATSVIARRTWRDGRGSLWHGVRQLSTLRTPTGARAWCMRASATQGRRPGRCGGELLEPAGPQTHASRAVSRAPQAMQFRLARCIAR